MSKIGRRPIKLNTVKIDIQGQDVHYKGQFASGVHSIPVELGTVVTDETLALVPAKKTKDTNRLWGLHRALLAAKIEGAFKPFEKQVKITGLGFKAVVQGKKVEFSLGYSHKINFDLPEGVTLETDKTGQLLTVKSSNKELMGEVCGKFRRLRPVEPYKGTGIMVAGDILIKKAGKGKGK